MKCRKGMTLYEIIFSMATLGIVTSATATLMTRSFEMARRMNADRRDEAVVRTMARQFRRDVRGADGIESEASAPVVDDAESLRSVRIRFGDNKNVRYELVDGTVQREIRFSEGTGGEGVREESSRQMFPLSNRLDVRLRMRPVPALEIERVDPVTGVRTPYRMVTAQTPGSTGQESSATVSPARDATDASAEIFKADRPESNGEDESIPGEIEEISDEK